MDITTTVKRDGTVYATRTTSHTCVTGAIFESSDQTYIGEVHKNHNGWEAFPSSGDPVAGLPLRRDAVDVLLDRW